MRIIVDFQAVQSPGSKNQGIGRYSHSLITELIKNRGAHEILLVLNGFFSDCVNEIRTKYKELLPPENLKVWYVSEPVSFIDEQNQWRRKVVELTREAFIASLKPDMVIVTSLFEGLVDNCVTSIGIFGYKIPTAVIHYDHIPLFEKKYLKNSIQKKWFEEKQESLRRADLLLAISGSSRQDAIQSHGISEDKIISLFCEDDECLLPLSSEEQNNSRILWEKSAKKTIEAIEKFNFKKISAVLNGQSEKILPRLAYLSPLPPARSGISDYSAELLPELANYYQIDVINDQAEISDNWIKNNCEIRSYAFFIKNAKSYDRVLYHFGNSEFHKNMFSTLRMIPGIVVLHDFYLSGIVNYLEDRKVTPNALTEALYQSHGYLPFNELNNLKNRPDLVRDFPCNLDVLQNAKGIIVHSNYSCRLANQWYGKDSSADWSVIPLLKVPVNNIDSVQAREKLHIDLNSFVVCSFGMLQATKLNKELLDSWLDSSLSKDVNCILVFVGENPKGEYGDELDEIIKESGSHRIRITGWVDPETYKNYLALADLGVQLRTNSRGETSAALLDCLNYGLATIANGNGSISELPDDVICKIPDNFKNYELIEALENLRSDAIKRKQISEHAREYIQVVHNPKICAENYVRSIESFYKFPVKVHSDLLQSIGKLDVVPKGDADIVSAANSIAQNFPLSPRQKQLFVDVSAICQDDLKTGIQRVVRSILIELLKNPPEGFRVEPVYAKIDEPYKYARQFTMGFLNFFEDIFTDDIIEYNSGDFFLGLDLCGAIITHHFHFFQELNNKGVRINFIVNDLLPIKLPDTFPQGTFSVFEKWLQTVLKVSDRLICISQSTASDVLDYIDDQKDVISKDIDVSYFHLGSDIENSMPSMGLSDDYPFIMDNIRNRLSFLMVGTIEPRKGHLQTISAFEELWDQNIDVNLVIVGNEGWKSIQENHRKTIPEIVNRLSDHEQLNKHLFWLYGISDEYLDRVYSACTCLLFPSEGEGFGLPLVEAAQHKKPILARDIPVFREIAGEYACYFSGKNASDLSEAIKDWIKLYKNREVPQSENMPFLTWAQSAEQLKSAIFKTKRR